MQFKKAKVLDDCKHMIHAVEVMLEIAMLALLVYLIGVWFYRDPSKASYYWRGEYILTGIYIAIISVVTSLCDGFAYGQLKLVDVFAAKIIAILITNFITYFLLCLILNQMVSPLPILSCFFASVGLSFLCCLLFTKLYHSFYVPHNILLIYGKEEALDIKFKMDERHDKYAIKELLPADSDMDAIKAAIGRHDAVLINDVVDEKRNSVLKYCHEIGIRTYVVPKISDIILEGARSVTLFDTPLKMVAPPHLSFPARFVKRAFDIILCVIALIPCAPVMLIVALAIKLEDHGPVFYRQKRVTQGGRIFEILKFRSMVVDAEKGGYNMSMRASGHDSRITKVGKVIRALRVDELPQIFNILRGDMSIVGPRPERVENVDAYSKMIPEWHLREAVKGGLTGYAQVFGRYNTSPLDKVKMDLMYIENYSLLLDVKLILLTVRVLFSKEATEGFDADERRKNARRELMEKFGLKED